MPKIGVVTHTFNESLLLAQWLEWHKDIFDCGVIIDHHSTDGSVEALTLPENWETRKSRLPNFEAEAVDREVEDVEAYLKDKYNLDFVMTLNVTEFIWSKDFRGEIEQIHNSTPHQAYGMLSYCLVDPSPNSSVNPLDHTHGFLSDGTQQGIICRHRRYIHSSPSPGVYTPGRHTVHLSNTDLPQSFILHYSFAPYPLCRERKLQIQTRIPESDRHQSRGVQHFLNEFTLTDLYNTHLKYSKDLLQDPNYESIYRTKF